MALQVNTILGKLKQILPIGNTNIYDEQLKLLIQSSMSKLNSEGVENMYDEPTEAKPLTDEACEYITCVAYQVAKDMDFEIDSSRLDEQYITRVNTLRTRQSHIKAHANNQDSM